MELWACGLKPLALLNFNTTATIPQVDLTPTGGPSHTNLSQNVALIPQVDLTNSQTPPIDGASTRRLLTATANSAQQHGAQSTAVNKICIKGEFGPQYHALQWVQLFRTNLTNDSTTQACCMQENCSPSTLPSANPRQQITLCGDIFSM